MDVKTPADGPRLPRLNPFTFPSDTTFRFLLLIVAVLGASAFIYDYIFFTYNSHAYLHANTACRDSAARLYPAGSAELATEYFRCMAPMARREALWGFTGIALLLIVATLGYFAVPSWKIWRNHFTVLEEKDAPDIVAYLRALCSEIGLARPPTFLSDPLNPSISGLGFGCLGRYFVVLHGGLITQFYVDKPGFRAIALHELAHLRNGDVDKAYYSAAIWRGFVIVGLLPYAFALLFPPAGIQRASVAYLAGAILRFGGLALVVYLVYKAVLRAREIYADLRASVYDGPAGSLDRILATRLSAPRRGLRFFASHPTPDQRRRMLADPSQLFRASFWDGAAAGVTCTIAIAAVDLLLNRLTSGSLQRVLGLTGGERAALSAALIFFPLMGGVLVVGTWRQQIASMLHAIRSYGSLKLGLGLALGAIAGVWLSPSNLVASLQGSALVLFAYHLVSALAFGAFLFFVLRWVVIVTSMWLSVTMLSRSPRLLHILLVLTGVMLVIVFGRIFLLYILGETVAQTQDLALMGDFLLVTVVVGFLPDALTTLVCISLWAFPLTALFIRRGAGSGSDASWLLLEQSPEPLAVQRPETFRIGFPLLFGVVGGLLSCALMLAAGSLAHNGVAGLLPPGSDRTEPFLYVLYTLAALVQVVVALALLFFSRKRSAAVQALFAAFICACVSTLGMVAVELAIVGGSVGLDSIWLFFANMTGIGTLLTWPVVMVVSAILDWLLQPRRAQEQDTILAKQPLANAH